MELPFLFVPYWFCCTQLYQVTVLGSTYACSRVIHHCPTKEQTTSYAFRVCAPTNRANAILLQQGSSTIGLWQKRVSYVRCCQ